MKMSVVIGSPWGSAVLAFGAVLLLTPAVIRLARRMDWLAYPKADRWHERPTALMGGIAMYMAATLAVILFGGLSGQMPYALWGGATLMFAVGLADDVWGVQPIAKLVAQVAGTALLLYAGYAFGQGGPYWLTIPLTFLWVIGITNAVNLLDNMDGLAAGVAAITASALALFYSAEGGGVGMLAVTAVAGASAGFLVYNFKPATIFMGDCGSLFLGYVIAAFAVVMQGEVGGPGGLGIYLVPVAVLAVPIFDTTLVTVVRTLSGRAVSQGGRDHSSHRLVFLGLSERGAVLTLYAISAAFGALALVFHVAEVTLFYALTVFAVVGLAVFGIHLGSVDVYEQTAGAQGDGIPADGAAEAGADRGRWSGGSAPWPYKTARVLRGLMGRHWKALLGMVGDLLLIAAAFILAHYLRFEHGLAGSREQFLITALPGVVAIKLIVFWATGLYRGLWRHAGTPEVVLVAKASTLASGVAYAALAVPYGTAFLSEATALIDWMIVTIAVAGVRFGFRGLRQYLSAKRSTGRRVLLYGAGDAGLLTLRELRQNPALSFNPVGFVDDDPAKRHLTVQGVPVLGDLDDLPVLCAAHRIDEVLITTARMAEARRARIVRVCAQEGVACRAFDLSFTLLSSGDVSSVEVPPALTITPSSLRPSSARARLR